MRHTNYQSLKIKSQIRRKLKILYKIYALDTSIRTTRNETNKLYFGNI